jgi:hypothetical protein
MNAGIGQRPSGDQGLQLGSFSQLFNQDGSQLGRRSLLHERHERLKFSERHRFLGIVGIHASQSQFRGQGCP